MPRYDMSEKTFMTRPAVNELCAKKELNHRNRIHDKKKRTIKSSIDTSAPRVYPHLNLRLKKLQMQAQRDAEIHRANLVLVSKMQDIIYKKQVSDTLINNKVPRTLNKGIRTKELVRIMDENVRILDRIVTAPSTYNHSRWEREYETNSKFLKNISKFPPLAHTLASPTGGKTRLEPLDASGIGKSDEVLKKGYAEKRSSRRAGQRNTKELFNQMITVGGHQTHLRVFERHHPNALELKAYVPQTDMEYQLKIPFDKLQECFPEEKQDLFRPNKRKMLIERLVGYLVFAPGSNGGSLELCIEVGDDAHHGDTAKDEAAAEAAPVDTPPAPVADEATAADAAAAPAAEDATANTPGPGEQPAVDG